MTLREHDLHGLWLVTGPPGTGKTTFLARQAQLAATKHGADSVVIASLTRAAAAEIAGRDTTIPAENVGTLHAHCYRALDRPQLAETPEGIREFNDAHPGQQLTRGTNQLEDAPTDAPGGASEGDSIHSQVMNNRARRLPVQAWTMAQQEHHQLWEDYKTQTGRKDFTDLIELAIAALDTHPAGPQVILLDEVQDFSRLELDLAQHWARHAQTTVLVGDPDQAIYQWRGADPDALRALPYTGQRILAQSHRVPGAVHRLATRWISQLDTHNAHKYQPRVEGGSAYASYSTIGNPDELVRQLKADLQTGRTVMVLASCGYMLAPLIAELRKHGVPFHNPYRATQGAWNPMRAAGRLKAFLRADPRVWGDQARCWSWHDLSYWTEPLQATEALVRGAKARIEEMVRPDQNGNSFGNAEVPIETLWELFGGEPRTRPALRGDVRWFEDVLLASKRKTMAYPIEVYRQNGPEALAGEPKLVVGTIHSVKGGEADSVYVAPDLSVTGYWHGWHHGGQARDQIVRMMYVALTRAREQVTVLSPSGPEHVPAELLMPEAETVAA